jgi:hypothetical protein
MENQSMNHKKLLAFPMLLVLGVLVLSATAYAQNSNHGNNNQGNDDHGNKNELGPYRFLTTISVTCPPGPATNPPCPLTGFDISWVDSEHARYYLASRGNAAAMPPVAPNIPVIGYGKPSVALFDSAVERPKRNRRVPQVR